LAARALARKRAHKNLIEGVSQETVAGLEALLAVNDEQGRTPLVWLREWPEKPTQKNLSGIIERLQAVRRLGVGTDREKRIHRARYAAIAREIAILVPRDVSRFDTHRRLATLVVFAREMEAILTDAALAMFGKMLGPCSAAPKASTRRGHRRICSKTYAKGFRLWSRLGFHDRRLIARGRFAAPPVLATCRFSPAGGRRPAFPDREWGGRVSFGAVY
jgi:hypothetical protein